MRSREEVVAAPEEDDFAIEYWDLPGFYGIVVMRLGDPDDVRAVGWDSMGKALSIEAERPIHRMRINRYVAGRWEALGVWAAGSGVHWADRPNMGQSSD